MYDIILFDLDGTLTDPGIGITNSVAHALAHWNIEVKDRAELYKFIGPPLSDSFMRYYGFTEEDAIHAIAVYREYFSVKGLYENEVYPGIPELLESLKAQGKTVVLATSKPEKFAVEILRHFGLYDYFDIIAGASMDESRNKKADVIAYAISQMKNPDLSRMIMIGDREHDILGAKQIGIDSIGVLYGYGDRAEHEKAGATYIAERVEDILPLL
jgi:phosphoglycolate phosphatase